MRPALLLLFAAACGPPPQAGPVLGRATRPYTAVPQYLAHPIAEHGLPPSEKDRRMSELLRAIDQQAAVPDAPYAQDTLRQNVASLGEVVPPKPDLQAPVDALRETVDELPRSSAELTRRRLWSLTDLIRLRANL